MGTVEYGGGSSVSNYPMGVSDNDEHFNLPSVGDPPAMIEVEVLCLECEGAKTVERTQLTRPNTDDPYDMITITCPYCFGEGVQVIQLCSGCRETEYQCKCE